MMLAGLMSQCHLHLSEVSKAYQNNRPSNLTRDMSCSRDPMFLVGES